MFALPPGIDLRLAFILGYGGKAAPLMRKVLGELSLSYGFRYVMVTERELESAVGEIGRADTAFVYACRLPKPVEEALRRVSTVVCIQPDLAHLSKAPPDAVELAAKLYKLGGRENLRALGLLMLRLAGVDVEVPDPKPVPWHGVYHPKLGTFERLEEYLSSYPYASRPLVGILFYRSDWLYGDTRLVDLLVESVESEGLGAVPVFTYGFRDALTGSPAADDTIAEFFFVDGKPVVDVLVNLTSFFLLSRGGEYGPRGFGGARGLELLKRLGVPILQAVRSYYRSREEWLKSEEGLDYMSQVYCVIMPEVDGAFQPLFVSGSRVSGDGVKRYDPVPEHARLLAKAAAGWVRLRRKPPSERRVAVVLINPPCKGVEANVAVGMGLDVPESVARFLARLRELGYRVSWVPRTGEELVKAIMERKAVSEFRWTPVEEIVARGGAAGYVSADQYLEWFSELPEPVRQRMVKEWGDPRNVLSGRAPRELVGMVYGGRFVVPGLLLGNVLVMPQPKRGCAGPRCDGRVCRILHDPTIPPPHQWLAAYRWATRVFGADVVIHFGTHGYMEFLPGKGVGLSWECWPEITWDGVPHLYVYVVSNPMEGVIAKRRGYAVLVDHLYPPMAMARVLDELDDLLTQYSRAKALGDSARAQAVLCQLLEAARKHHVPVRGKGEAAVEEIHRYVELVRGSQVNMGLHVLGSPPGGRRLAEYVAAAMAYDTHFSPSLKRVLAEYLGLDYDELRRRPLDYNDRLGMPNKDVLERLGEAAVEILERLLEAGEAGDDYVLRVVREVMAECFGVGR